MENVFWEKTKRWPLVASRQDTDVGVDKMFARPRVIMGNRYVTDTVFVESLNFAMAPFTFI